jgi:alpha-L-fucosidase
MSCPGRLARSVLLSAGLLPALVAPGAAAPPSTDRPELAQGLDNKPARLEWFRDLGFGMFIHWSVDSQIGSDISHSLAGASADYRTRYFDDLPGTWRPRKFDPDGWAVLARLAGMKYVVFTAKHHSGFAMWSTKTTPFSILRTPDRRDLLGEVVRAFRKQGLAVGLYFSPEDFHWLHTQGKPVTRRPHPGVLPGENPGLLELDRKQLRELATRYGRIDVWFLDGPGAGMRDVIWKAQPEAVITRDVIETPEQTIPGVPLDRVWESCLTMGTAWQYQPTHDRYRSGTELIQILIETRAKGGNLLLNVGPKPDGELPIEQEERLREIALWNFAYGESITAVRPWVVTNEGNLWFTRKKSEDGSDRKDSDKKGEETVYVFITGTSWVMGERKTFRVRSIRPTGGTQVSVLGADGKILEYRPDVDASPRWRAEGGGIELDIMMAQRLYNARKWPNPVVVKLTKVEPALSPPEVATVRTQVGAGGGEVVLVGDLRSLGQAPAVEVGFEYRRRKQVEELLHADAPWRPTPLSRRQSPGQFTATVKDLDRRQGYEFRALVKHPLLTVHGEERPVADR